jgi:hypothetical protein
VAPKGSVVRFGVISLRAVRYCHLEVFKRAADEADVPPPPPRPVLLESQGQFLEEAVTNSLHASFWLD